MGLDDLVGGRCVDCGDNGDTIGTEYEWEQTYVCAPSGSGRGVAYRCRDSKACKERIVVATQKELRYQAALLKTGDYSRAEIIETVIVLVKKLNRLTKPTVKPKSIRTLRDVFACPEEAMELKRQVEEVLGHLEGWAGPTSYEVTFL